MLLDRPIEEIVSEIETADSVESLERRLTKRFHDVGFEGFTFVHINPGSGISSIDLRAGEWIRRYNRRGYAERDPLILEAVGASNSFRWTDRVRPVGLEQSKIWSEASEIGLRDGFMIPVKTMTVERAYLSLYSSRPHDVGDALHGYRRDLELCALLIYRAYVGLKRPQFKDLHLTSREREVLLWAARGKTIRDTAIIMGITDNTVKTHMQHCIEKLDAQNKTHAVTRAVHLQLIGI